MTEPTKVRLARELQKAGFEAFAVRAESGEFDDYESPHATPQVALVVALNAIDTAEAHAFAKRVIRGEFDGTKEEGEAWWEREGKHLPL